MEDLRTWVAWITVGAVGLGPILIFWMAMVIALFLQDKRWERRQRRLMGPSPSLTAPSARAAMSAHNLPIGGKRPAEAAD
jgi:hypothetical protein